ncbi:class I SAM-dependent methyltransferase [Brachybacterium sp. Z12]|uniref:class I SAM-dependent methyltransferase n=1 Tax=Brachybacterium sp. Z12 TaxID=2759167 RepID=UPI00223B1BF0|nr:class I SAM-dependent methyltransferase [Brachybacterium sp. Z12]
MSEDAARRVGRLALPPDLSERDLRAVELMDDPDCDPRRLARTYARFRMLNSLVAGWRTTYRRHLRPRFHAHGPTTLLDLGSGGGDLARALARWARRDGFDLRVTGIDPDPRAFTWSRSRPPVAGVQFRRASSEELVADGSRFDLVTSNHLLHHLSPQQRDDVLTDSEQLARLAAVHSDIQRSRLGYALFSVASLPLAPGSFIREDGLTSIRRSYTAAELRLIAPRGWAVEALGPWRLLLVHDSR